jgi:arginine-tRNA-protein transferase
MDRGFRRSGRIIYQPICDGCRACRPIRVPVATFKPSKSQRRVHRRNADLALTVSRPAPSDEKLDLYRRYVTQWHGRDSREEDRETFESFLYDSPVETLEFAYRDAAGRLIGVGLCDVCTKSLSSVYFYFDPDEARRAIGTYSAIIEIETAMEMGIPHYYLGYWIQACAAMEYKSNFRPFELLQANGTWQGESA